MEEVFNIFTGIKDFKYFMSVAFCDRKFRQYQRLIQLRAYLILLFFISLTCVKAFSCVLRVTFCIIGTTETSEIYCDVSSADIDIQQYRVRAGTLTPQNCNKKLR